MVIHGIFTNQNGGINRKYPLVMFHILGMSSSQLTNSIIFQRGRAQPPTRLLWVMNHDFFLHQSIRRKTLWRMSSNIMRIARISTCPNARKCAMLVPSGHRKKVRFFRPQAYVHQLLLCQQIIPPCQRCDHGSFTRRHQADDGWNWIYLTPRYTVNTRNFMVSVMIWIRHIRMNYWIVFFSF